MEKKNYFLWLSENTASEWVNDSAVIEQVEAAARNGAVGCTTNPPLSFEALTVDAGLYADGLRRIDADLGAGSGDDEWALEAMGLVVKRLARRFLPMHKEKGGFRGAVRAQVQPGLRDDAEGMLARAKHMSGWGENVFIKIPVTEAGLWVLEELAAMGIPTNPTVATTVSQAVAAAEAYERGAARAAKAGIRPAASTMAFVLGRTQDYLAKLSSERGLDLATGDLEIAVAAIAKRLGRIYKERGFASVLMPAAFRCAMQVGQLAGAPFCFSVHPKIQAMVHDAEEKGEMRRAELFGEPAEDSAVMRVAEALPEFLQAYEPGALSPPEFGTYGATSMTLDAFDATGWQKLITLRDSYR